MSLLKLVACLAAPVVAAAGRVAESGQQQDVHLTVDHYKHIPDLDVVYTSDPTRAATVLDKWASGREFGLYMQRSPTEHQLFFPYRLTLLAISTGTQVLLFDLKPHLRPVPKPLPPFLSEFLESNNRTFYGMGLLDTAARLAFEFDCVVRGVDFRIRAWPEMKMGGGLYGLARRYLHVNVQRPALLMQASLSPTAVHTYLHGALANYFLRFHGPCPQDWVLTKAELFSAGPVYLHVPAPRHEWAEARKEWLARRADKGQTVLREAMGLMTRRAYRAPMYDFADDNWQTEGDDVFTHPI